ncbi:MAG: hypothetical protein ACQESP_05465 [Candidatus Muiribacteriota bacterium]
MNDSELFNSMLLEMINIFSGRVAVCLNETLESYVDIGLPAQKKLYLDNIEERGEEILVFKNDLIISGKNQAILLFFYIDKVKKFYNLNKAFLYEVGENFKYILEEILEILCFEEEFEIKENYIKNEYLSSVVANEICFRMQCADCCNLISNNLFESKQNKDIGGVYIFF